MKPSRRPTGRRSLGQHYLRSERTALRIIDALGDVAGKWVVEVGPGRGALTRPLLARAGIVLAVEIDASLAGSLQRELGCDRLRVVVADARTADIGGLLSEAGALLPVFLVANLPYESATPMIRSFVRRPKVLSRLVVMVQKEVAERLAARPRTPEYGFLTVDVGAYAVVRRLFDVPPGDFAPPPRVTSSVIEIVPHAPRAESAAALAVASAGFAARRKTLLNSLGARWPRESVAEALSGEGLLPTARAEELALAQFEALARRLGASAGAPKGL